jgi:hypothetical protein
MLPQTYASRTQKGGKCSLALSHTLIKRKRVLRGDKKISDHFASGLDK